VLLCSWTLSRGKCGWRKVERRWSLWTIFELVWDFFSQVISFSFFFFPAYMVSSEEITLTTPLVPLIDARDSQSN
jgi:hypothetical protein